ncbi:hypothetical protein [Streptomyces sp. NPDC051219]|uniref:hypothetical protein n=1 Tax=Streptomyces sp. NPDC051219 TaxID=3155283 RepID=UPI00341D99B6
MSDATDTIPGTTETVTPYTTPGRLVIPCYCWVRKSGTQSRCTREPHATGVHFDSYSGQRWSHRGPEPQ